MIEVHFYLFYFNYNHASPKDKGALSAKTLYRYLIQSRARPGIMVARVFLKRLYLSGALNRQAVVLPKTHDAVRFNPIFVAPTYLTQVILARQNIKETFSIQK
jgi:hypothetical protein